MVFNIMYPLFIKNMSFELNTVKLKPWIGQGLDHNCKKGDKGAKLVDVLF